MIYIIDYDKEGAENAARMVAQFSDDVKIGKNEMEIVGAEKVILPDTSFPKKALKKLHLFNLYSALRIYKKPILGIGAGFALMCNEFNEQNALGFFNCKAKGNDSDYEVFDLENDKKIVEQKLTVSNYWGIPSLSDEESVRQIVKEFVEL